MRQQAHLNNALDNALVRYEDIRGKPFPCVPIRNFIQNEAFEAIAIPHNDTVEIQVTTGVVDALCQLWDKTTEYSDSLPEEDQFNFENIDQVIEASLTWLMLHELMHFEMGHFKINGGLALVESMRPEAMGLISRSKQEPSLIDAIPEKERLLARRCLELQADHDATDILMEGYSVETWDVLRFHAAAVFAVMVLIEREGASENENTRSYPKAATRIFQLLGYLSTVWSIPAILNAQRNGWDEQRPEDIPSDEEIAAFHGHVVAPALSDANLIAKANDARNVSYDIGAEEHFVADVRLAQKPDGADINDFNTIGAKEYAQLSPVNQTVMTLLQINPFSP